MNENVKIKQSCYDIIESYESLHDGDLRVIGLQPKLCPANVWTEGYGRAMKFEDGSFMRKSNTTYEEALARQTIKTVKEAEIALLEDTEEFSEKIKPFIKVKINNQIFSSFISMAYNIGDNAFKNSTLLKKVNLKDFIGASEQFKVWNKSGGKVMLGLTRRRKSEKNLFLQGLKELQINEIIGGYNV